MKKKYYRNIAEFNGEEQDKDIKGQSNRLTDMFDDETVNALSSRRDFLKLFGFSIASVAVAASCEQPIRKAIPYLIRPESIIPGKANYYASTFYDGSDYCSVLVKVRDGRPVKIEGNELSSVTKGGTNARTQASVLGLYDTARYQYPLINGKKSEWDLVDKKIINLLNTLSAQNRQVVLLTPTIISPATKEIIDTFIKKYPVTRHIQYDSISYSGMLEANRFVFGKQVLPSYQFDKANLVVSFGADFLGTWLSPVEFTKQYVTKRKLDEGQKTMLKHIHLEGGMSLTGSNADERIVIKPSQEKIILANLFKQILKAKTGRVINVAPCSFDVMSMAKTLVKNSGGSLLISGSNDTGCHVLVNGINYLLGNYGGTINIDQPLYVRQGLDKEMTEFINALDKGKIGGVICYNVNPAYDHPLANKFVKGLKKCELSVSLPNLRDETAGFTTYVCPDHHYLESWNDAEVKKGFYSLAQPVIHPIFNTRCAQESLLKWAGINTLYDEYLKAYWKKRVYPLSTSFTSFYDFWTRSLQDGVFEQSIQKAKNINTNLNTIVGVAKNTRAIKDDSFEIILYENVSVGNGKQANNPWLQELPDPVSKVCWDNYAAISPKLANELGLTDGSLVSVNGIFTLPVLVQPGQEHKTISIALGFGRRNAGKVADGVGVDMYPLVSIKYQNRMYTNQVKIEAKKGNYPLAMTQTHHSMEGREIVRETTLKEYHRNPASGNETHKEIEEHHVSLYKKHEFKGHHWGMAIDLNSCIGCSACVIACSAENNVPVVGKQQVQRVHEMHWIRIDRYYSGNPANPEVVRQPVMCQHCDNAPCENVCPVAATNHSDEGLNQMVYNRCIGTRYCNNNCPYKVRRFNFFDYTKADAIPFNTKDAAGMTLDLKRMVLNPDVTVRAKGVIEKCSMCVQRIQEKKLNAKLEKRPLKDGEIKPACAQACPADAIVFGDLNDPESKVSKMFKDKRNYHLLEELHTLPSVGYLAKVRNRKQHKK